MLCIFHNLIRLTSRKKVLKVTIKPIIKPSHEATVLVENLFSSDFALSVLSSFSTTRYQKRHIVKNGKRYFQPNIATIKMGPATKVNPTPEAKPLISNYLDVFIHLTLPTPRPSVESTFVVGLVNCLHIVQQF